MEKLNFKNEFYKQKSLTLNYMAGETHSPSEAFFLLINGVAKDDLINLCELIAQTCNMKIDESYELTQNLNANSEIKNSILNLAYECIKNGKNLGNKTINDGKINTSSWISHCLYVSEVCSTIADILNLNADEAKTFGILHDYGRKFTHTFQHAMAGFEALSDLNWNNEAIGCLTHSFLNGGRCSNNEQAMKGFYVDEHGDPKWEDNAVKDDVTYFLESYKYTPYDSILNIADLMATDKGILAPHERIADIATRRTIDPTNRGYFLCDVNNLLVGFLEKLGVKNDELGYIKATNSVSLEEIQNYFNNVSNYFYNEYKKLSEKRNKLKKQTF